MLEELEIAVDIKFPVEDPHPLRAAEKLRVEHHRKSAARIIGDIAGEAFGQLGCEGDAIVVFLFEDVDIGTSGERLVDGARTSGFEEPYVMAEVIFQSFLYFPHQVQVIGHHDMIVDLEHRPIYGDIFYFPGDDLPEIAELDAWGMLDAAGIARQC